ncbi:MAG: UDP-N-acetylmuramoyl-L-alanine--D-glutamate ligase [Chlamydiia bacterium]|nr:UDP-N-acetylmuramoyl-L-alanine--D-glutamate ligase [Chlamydiia bacterium]
MRQKALVLGLGVSGRSSAAFLQKQGFQVIGADKAADPLRSDPQIAKLVSEGMELVPDTEWVSCQLVILSPGIPPTHPLVLKAAENQIEVVGEAELAIRYLRNRCIGITGTNGKTTTSMLVSHILQSAGKKARAVGNIGLSLTEYLLQADPEEILVVELSSFQLETMKSAVFEIGAILNITPNHLNWHPDMLSYAKAKIQLARCLRADGELFLSPQVAEDYGASMGRHYSIFDRKMVALNSQLSYIKKGLPEPENIAAAFAVCRRLGVPDETAARALESFRKPPHRIEWVADIAGVSYYNDSKASNIHAVMHAVSLFEPPLVLLVGGVHKGASYLPWIEAFRGKVDRIIAFGEASAQMEVELAAAYPFARAQDLEEAVRKAAKIQEPPYTVLLSPGCSSYDQFRSYEHRGEEFKRMVRGFQ